MLISVTNESILADLSILQLIYFIIVSAFVEVQVSMTFGNLVQ